MALAITGCHLIAGYPDPTPAPDGNASVGGANTGAGGSPLSCDNDGDSCYSGPANTEGVGECASGFILCVADEAQCLEEVVPTTEICGNDVDEDCNGVAEAATRCLDDVDLVARYFIDARTLVEDGSGEIFGHQMDSAPDPFDLVIWTYQTGFPAHFVHPTGYQGLRWNAAGSQGSIFGTSVTNDKFPARLDGSTTMSVELVVDIEDNIASAAAGPDGSPLIQFSSPDDPHVLTVEAYGDGDVRMRWQGGTVAGVWQAPTESRAVLHLVIDTNEAAEEDRVRFYVAGNPTALKAQTMYTLPTLGQTLEMLSSSPVITSLGSKDLEFRSFKGVMYYAAVYQHAMSGTQVAEHASLLALSDDSPACSIDDECPRDEVCDLDTGACVPAS